jgi:putative ABC transport system permease protein
MKGRFKMDVIWKKVWRDLWNNKLRTALIILSTTVGLVGVGIVFGLSGMMQSEMTASHFRSNPPHMFLYTGDDRLDQDFVEAVQRDRDTAAAEGQATLSFRWKLDGETEWRDGLVIARNDYDKQSLFRIRLLEGRWPGRHALAVERLSQSYFNLPVGTTIIAEIEDRTYHLPIKSVAHHSYTPPPQIEGTGTFVVNMQTMAWLSDQDEIGFNNLYVALDTYTPEAALETVKDVKNRIENDGKEVPHWELFPPDRHWAQDIVSAVLLILGVLGGLSLALSGFLVINVTNAIIVQQVWQIGVMKVVGATSGQVVRVYMVAAAVYGLLSLAIAVPLSAIVAYYMAIWLLDIFNVILDQFQFAPSAVMVQVAAGLTVPVVSALVPALAGARITPHQAINSQGLAGNFGRGWLDRLLARIQQLPRPLALSLRNTFRRKVRIALTMLALTMGGIVFIMVTSVSSSFNNTLQMMISDFGLDAVAQFKRPYRVTKLVETAESVPGINHAEVWARDSGQLTLANDEKFGVGLWGIPADSQMFSPRLVKGRALIPGDQQAILLNSKIAAQRGFDVGDEIELTINGKKNTWTVVGLVLSNRNNFTDNFVSFDALARTTASVNRGSHLVTRFAPDTPKSPTQLIEAVRAALLNRNFELNRVQSAQEVQLNDTEGLSIIMILLKSMVVLVVIVGSAGLMSTMSINVVERGREIGVIRAIGATSPSIVGIFVFEGMLIGLLSWLLALPFSYPGARFFSNIVGVELLELPLDFTYSLRGAGLWLVIVVTVSALASLWPALRAARISVRETLAYE